MNIQCHRIWKLGLGSTVDPLSTHYRRTLCLKNQLIRFRTVGEKAFGVTLPRMKIANYQ